MAKVICFSKHDFDLQMLANKWNDNYLPNDVAIISICCTPDCIKGYLEARDPDAEDEHWFKKEKDNVINLNFDDIIQDSIESNGYTYSCITQEEANRLFEFIWKNKGKDVYVHCRAGKSRSQAVTFFMLEYFDKFYNWNEINKDNPPRHYNINVYSKLKKAYEKYNEENSEEYDYRKTCTKADKV